MEEYFISTYFADFERKISIPGLLMLLQDVAWKHASQFHFGYDDLRRMDLFWVLAKIKVIMHRYPQWTDMLRVYTWSKEPELLTAFRDYEGFDLHGDKFFTATSAWHILNASNRPQVLDNFRKGFPTAKGRHAIEEKPNKIAMVKNPQKTLKASVLPSDIDMHLHVNNTRYVQWTLDSFEFDYLNTHHVKEIEVNFLQQAKAGDMYFVATDALSGNDFISSVVREDDGKELARIHTIWTD